MYALWSTFGVVIYDLITITVLLFFLESASYSSLIETGRFFSPTLFSSLKQHLFGPVYRTVKVSLYLNMLLLRVNPFVAIVLPLAVVVSSLVLYAQGRLFAKLIGSLYLGNTDEYFFVLSLFVAALFVGLMLNLLVKKLTSSERYHIREYFDPLISSARTKLGMKSFNYPHNERLNQAEDGAFSIKFFAPLQVAFLAQVMNVALGLVFLFTYSDGGIASFLIPLILVLMIDLYQAAKVSKVEEESWKLFSEITETQRQFTYPDRFKGTLLFGMADSFINHIKQRSSAAYSFLRTHNLKAALLEAFNVALLWFLIAFAISNVIFSEQTVEIRVFLITSVIAVATSSKRLVECFSEQLLGSERVENLLDFERRNQSLSATNSTPNALNFEIPQSGELEFRGLSLCYVDGKNVIEDASAKIPADALVHVLGANGSGKTTLFAALSGLYDLPEGTSFFGGVDLSKVPTSLRMKYFRQLTQETVSFRNSFRETLAWAAGFMDPHDCPEDWIWEALKMACLDAKVRQAPDGLDQSLMISRVKEVGKTVSEQFNLSGGEMKRLNHAMFYIGMMHGEARLAILDEPYNNIDPQLSEKLRENVKKLPGIRLVATHDARHYLEDDNLVLFVEKQDLTGKTPRSRLILDTHANLLKSETYRNYLGI